MRVVVTGANRGIGEEVVRQLAESGHEVIGTSRRPDAEHPLDLTDSSSIRSFAERIGPVDVLIDNAAVLLRGFDAEIAGRTIAANVVGTIELTEALLPKLEPQGRVVIVSSGMGERDGFSGEARRALEDATLSRDAILELAQRFVDQVRGGTHTAFGWPSSAYSTSKGLLNAYARHLARELAEDSRGIRAVAVCPGWVQTDMGGAGAPRTVGQGAAGIVWAATDPGVPRHGFFRDARPIPW